MQTPIPQAIGRPRRAHCGSLLAQGIAFLLQWHANASSQGKSGLGDLLGAYPQGLPTYLGVQLVGPAVAKGTFADNFMADALAEVLVLVFQMPGLDTRAIFARCGCHTRACARASVSSCCFPAQRMTPAVGAGSVGRTAASRCPWRR